VRAALREVDPDQPLLNPQPYTSLIAQTVADRRLVMLLLAAFAGLALVLACLGVYSVMAYIVSQRTGEIGIRMALGANQSGVVRLVLRRVVWLVLAGIAVGTGLSLWATKFVATLLYGLQPGDASTLLLAAGLLGLIGLVAGWVPARRAARTDPTIVLRES